MNLQFLSAFVVGPACLRGSDVLLLAFLGAATDQNDDAVAILAEVDAVTGAEVDLVFKDAGTDTLDV